MKRALTSIVAGIVVFAVWMTLVGYTSQDFIHEGPNSIFYEPIDWWVSTFVAQFWKMWPLVNVKNDMVKLVVGLTLVCGPFILILSAVFYSTLYAFRKKDRK